MQKSRWVKEDLGKDSFEYFYVPFQENDEQKHANNKEKRRKKENNRRESVGGPESAGGVAEGMCVYVCVCVGGWSSGGHVCMCVCVCVGGGRGGGEMRLGAQQLL